MTATKAHVTIDLDDVQKAGGVAQAIVAWASESDDTSSGTVGAEFSTSGPGNGWSTTHGAADFAIRAFEGGALYYIDAEDGRLAEAVAVEEVEPAEGEEGKWEDADGCEWGADDVTYDGSGGWVLRTVEWSEGSVVRLEVPDLEDAIAHPATVAEMVEALDTHGACSDRKSWAELVRSIQKAAEELDGIDPDAIERE